MFIQAEVGREDHAEHANIDRRHDSIQINLQRQGCPVTTGCILNLPRVAPSYQDCVLHSEP